MPIPDTMIRPEVRALTPYNAGLSIDEVNARHAPARISKLGSNENPFGPSPRVADALRLSIAHIHLYPDSTGASLRQTIADHVKLADSDRIVLGNGSEDLISVVCRSVLKPLDRVVTLYPSFPLHEDYATTQGAMIDRVSVNDDLEIDVQAFAEAVSRPSRMVLFANPMNPVGAWLNGAGLADIVAASHPDSLLVIDEAYLEYAAGVDYPDTLSILAATNRPWVILRTLSKAWGLAGLRIGYAITSSAELAGFLNRVRTPFNANGLAQKAAIAALADSRHVETGVRHTLVERERLRSALVQRGFRVAPSKGNFLFFDVGGPSTVITDLLLVHGVIVKPWKQAGFDNFVRVSIGLQSENDHFLAALSEVIRFPREGVC